MRIAIIDMMFRWPPLGGACVDLKETATRLKRNGFDIDMFVPQIENIWPRGMIDENVLEFDVHKIKFSLWSFNGMVLPGRIKKAVDKVNPDYVLVCDSLLFKPHLINVFKNYKVVPRFYSYDFLCPVYGTLLRKVELYLM